MRNGVCQTAAAIAFLAAACVMALLQLRPRVTEALENQAGVKPTQMIRENHKDALEYVWIPSGTFQMGCSPRDTECSPDEKPPHRVTITKGFWMGRTEVTVGAYKRFMVASGRRMPRAPRFNANWANDNMPMVNVTWNEAHDYCTWAGGRLPSEAEWEYAARGGNTDARFGPLDVVAWYHGKGGSQTHAVAQKRANAFGLFDVLGNVWEWVGDWYDEDYYRKSPSQDPPGPSKGWQRVYRGGSWFSNPGFVRVSVRNGELPAVEDPTFGFRCVWGLAGPEALPQGSGG